jgi:hypothetical protein
MNNELLIKMITDSWREQLIATNKIFDNLSDEESIHEVSPTIAANMKHSL